jgi:ribose transport system ATP-binding protein/rhamnose transport system ATP-binding protein
MSVPAPPPGARPPRLVVRDVTKAFPGVQALAGVSLTVGAGEVHALLGENGAGKSTLGKIIGGVYARDAGEIELDGRPLGNIDEAEAGKLGIAVVHQEGSLVPQLSIAENIFAGRQPTGFLGTVDRRAMAKRTSELLADLGVPLDPFLPVRALSAAQAQVIEIAKALSRDLRLLILDEPTSALTLTETERLFAIVRRLKANGVSIIYVSHRLAEIFALCDRVTVLKDGRLSGTRDVAGTSEDELIRLMVGRDVLFAREDGGSPGAVVLEVERLAAAPHVRDASFTVRAGEIVCLSGLVGSGRSETCEAIFGARRRDAGRVCVAGKEVRFSGPWDAIAAGVGMMPEDRKEAGLFLSHSIAANISATVLGEVSPRGVFSEEKAAALAGRFIRELRIATPSAAQAVGNLSGGNQQKVLLAKWLAPEPRLLIVDEPTRGVDVGARAEIYRILRGLKDKGLAVLVVSSDLPEVLTLADRIIVMADGRTVGELAGATATEEKVLRLATRFTTLDNTRTAA